MAFKAFLIASLVAAPSYSNAQCTSTSLTAYYDQIMTCYNSVTTGIQSCGSATTPEAAKACICPVFETYFTCLTSGDLCLDASTRSTISTAISSYRTTLSSYCPTGFVYPTYTVSFTIAGSSFVGFSRFTAAQYITLCENIFDALGYSSATYTTWCASWSDYLTYTGLVSPSRRERRADDLGVEVKIPSDDGIPPVTDLSSISVVYTDTSDSEVTQTANISSVSTQTSTGGGGGGGGAQPQDFSAILTAALAVAGGALAAL